MNFQNLNFDHVEPPRQWPPQFQTTETLRPDSESATSHQPRQYSHHHRRQHAHAGPDLSLDSWSQSHPQSQSAQPTVAPHAPSPPSPSESTPEIYGPDRHHQHRQGHPPPRPAYNPPQRLQDAAPAVRFDEAQLAMLAAQNANANAHQMAGLKDELAIAAGKVTPGVDDTPYIQYAIQALTRSRDSDQFSDGDFEDEMEGVPPPPSRTRIQDEEMGYPPVLDAPESSYPGHRDRDTDTRRRASSDSMERPPLSEDDQLRTLSPISGRMQTPTPPPVPRQTTVQQHAAPPSGSTRAAVPDPVWVPVTKDMRDNFYPNDTSYPSLTYKPRILRPFSIIIFMSLCLLMTAALVASAVLSDSHTGLIPYPGTIYSGQYFLFRLLPQLLAAIILVYAQSIVSSSLRILPFAAMASEDARERYLALFQRLYPSTFLWPRLVGPWQFKAFSVATWIALCTIPLQSSLFTCIFVDDEKWIWATTQGVAWVLVALYLILTGAAGVLMMFWFRKWTGLVWDVRSLGDLIPLLNRSNTTQGYKGADTAESTHTLKGQLRDRWFDRLGYWRMQDMQTGGIWYSIGTSGTPTDQDPRAVHDMMRKRPSHNPSLGSHDLGVPTTMPESRHRYLPWCLRDMPIVVSAVTAGALLLALLIVSFLPQTRLEAGFLPLLSAKPGHAAFSAANFLYSFLPSLLGMVLFLLFQSLDQALRIVQPWGELSKPDGGVARKSILADYAACLPLETTWRAARLGHWRLAVVSLLAVLSLAIPVLAGGLFIALTVPSGQVRMFPNIPVYGVLLAFLFLYVGALTLLLPRRRQFRLPHAAECLADMISFCSADELTQDTAFRAVRSRDDLEARLGVDGASYAREESVWFFGVVPGKDERRLSVRRMRRFTEKMTVGRSFTRSMV